MREVRSFCETFTSFIFPRLSNQRIDKGSFARYTISTYCDFIKKLYRQTHQLIISVTSVVRNDVLVSFPHYLIGCVTFMSPGTNSLISIYLFNSLLEFNLSFIVSKTIFLSKFSLEKLDIKSLTSDLTPS